MHRIPSSPVFPKTELQRFWEGLNLELRWSKGKYWVRRWTTAEDVASAFVNDARRCLSDQDAEECRDILSDLKNEWDYWLKYRVKCKSSGRVFCKAFSKAFSVKARKRKHESICLRITN